MTVLTAAYDALARCTQDMHCVTGADRQIVLATGRWEDAAGVACAELAGRPIETVARPEHRELLRVRHEAAAAGVPPLRFDVALAGSGTGVVHEVTLTVDGPHVVTSFRDVTRERKTERALAALNERLGHANRELSRSNAELERFACVASHDLSEPLRMVTSYCALLVSHCGDALDETAKEYVAYASEGALRMRALIDDLLTYARVATLTAPMATVDLNRVFDDARRDLARVIGGARANVVVDRLPSVPGYESQLRQLATNLLANAVKFRTPGVPPRVRVSAQVAGGDVTLSVSDNGIGIEPRHRERIFDMFKRLHGRAAYDGNGIGLALCKRIAERHNGRVWVESAAGGGSVFHVLLRRADVVELTA